MFHAKFPFVTSTRAECISARCRLLDIIGQQMRAKKAGI
jgi:hypothetical protein